MTSSVRRYLLEKHQEELQEWGESEDSGPTEGLALEIEERQNYLDAIREFNPGASFTEQLAVRLMGGAARRGLLDLQLAPILDGISRIFQDARSVNMGLEGVGTGSTVLYLRPVPISLADDSEGDEPDLVLDDPEAPVSATAADDIGRTLIKVVEATEEAADLRGFTRYVKGLEMVSDTLDEHDLEAEFLWSSMSGNRSTARLTSAGRGYLRRLKQVSPKTTETPVSGRVVELRESGYVKIKSGSARRSPSYDVHVERDTLLDLRLSLGDTVHMLIEEQLERDQLGRETKRRYEFIRRIYSTDELGLDEDSS
ncbi:hypothetical protein GCM10028784_07110 [Myceligenerans cantabricum]